MSMTREEAIEELERLLSHWDDLENGKRSFRWYSKDAVGLAITALRPVSREQVEKMWRGCPECKPRCGLCVHMGQWDKYGKPYVCEKCVGFSNFESDQKFCECCGRPLTDEAVEIRLKELEALKDGSTTD